MTTITKELLGPVLAVAASVLLFLVMLIFQSSGSSKVKVSKSSDDGTKYVQENGQTVRRSTRERKPVVFSSPEPTKKVETTPKSKTTATKAPATKTPLSGSKTTPKTAAVEPSPITTRSTRRTPRV